MLQINSSALVAYRTHRPSPFLQPAKTLWFFRVLAMGSHASEHTQEWWVASKCNQCPDLVSFLLYISILNSRLSQVAFLLLVFCPNRPLSNGPWKLSLEDPACDLSAHSPDQDQHWQRKGGQIEIGTNESIQYTEWLRAWMLPGWCC